ncbi:MAG: DNA repair protein RecN [Lysobacterales bacterium]|jgi:DNA repair protein RecN (Recombination protein N)
MLRFLQIRDYAIIDRLDLDIAPGFTCISGETGAGKSILVGALGLLCGARADTGAIRQGAVQAELSAGFELAEDSPALDWLCDAELDDGDACLLRRLISAEGRSRAWINGRAVTLQQLGSLGDLLVEIHGQNEHIRLVQSEEQFRLLDAGGQYNESLAALDAAYQRWLSLDLERKSLLEEQPMSPGDLDLLKYQLSELEEAVMTPEAFRELESGFRALARGGETLAALETVIEGLESHRGGAGALHKAAESLQSHAEIDPEVTEAVGLLREAAINCDEALAGLQNAVSRLDLSPERLDEMERRLGVQYDLARKHRVEPEQLAETLERLRDRLDRADSQEQRLASVERDLKNARAAYDAAAADVHTARRARARELSDTVTGLMAQLGMPDGRFLFGVTPEPGKKPSARGSDRIELLVSANPGMEPGPLKKIASGGELSRISLAVKVAARSSTAAATQIFDEVDAGIGGETANAVGALISKLAENGQALCVTHLAQVAAFADQQVSVRKAAADGLTRVETSLLTEQERVDEIARMLGGRVSAQSRAHAAELLATGADPRGSGSGTAAGS